MMFNFILLLTITVFLLCCLRLCCFLNKLQALFYHHLQILSEIRNEIQKTLTIKIKHNL
jgi:hypothetical protein